MGDCVCKNPNCNKKYEVSKGDVNDGFCSFECWEAVNVVEPKETPTETFVLD